MFDLKKNVRLYTNKIFEEFPSSCFNIIQREKGVKGDPTMTALKHKYIITKTKTIYIYVLYVVFSLTGLDL